MNMPSFPQIDGVDSDAAIARCAGNVELYKKILLHFCQSQSDSPGKLRELYASDSKDDIQSLAHAIKGAAANLGLTEITSHAQAIEYSIRHNSLCSEDQIGQLCQSVSATIELLSSVLKDEPPQQDKASIAPLEVVRTLLQQADPQVTEKLQMLVDHTQEGAKQSKLREALILCQLYQFDQALDALAEI